MSRSNGFRNQGYARQLIRFDGLEWGTIRPTDIDGAVEFGDKLFVFIEAKHGYTDITTGQRLLMERTVKRINASGASAYAIQCMHYKSGDIELKKCKVVKFFDGKRWRKPKRKINIGEAIKQLRKKHL